jgi:hypothetical protein
MPLILDNPVGPFIFWECRFCKKPFLMTDMGADHEKICGLRDNATQEERDKSDADIAEHDDFVQSVVGG